MARPVDEVDRDELDRDELDRVACHEDACILHRHCAIGNSFPGSALS
jgi:hypothetical protein